MDSALKTLREIYDNNLLKEWSTDDLKTFNDMLIRNTNNWERKKRVHELADLYRNNKEEYMRQSTEAHDKMQSASAYLRPSENYHNGLCILYQDAFQLYQQQEKEKERQEALKAHVDGMRKRKETEIIIEARKRIENLKREEAIQNKMQELLNNNTL